MSSPGAGTARRSEAQEIIEEGDASLLDLVDHVLDKGVVLTGEVILGLADVDLIYLRLSALLCAADRVLPKKPREEA
jgi:hypothetical protein